MLNFPISSDGPTPPDPSTSTHHRIQAMRAISALVNTCDVMVASLHRHNQHTHYGAGSDDINFTWGEWYYDQPFAELQRIRDAVLPGGRVEGYLWRGADQLRDAAIHGWRTSFLRVDPAVRTLIGRATNLLSHGLLWLPVPKLQKWAWLWIDGHQDCLDRARVIDHMSNFRPLADAEEGRTRIGRQREQFDAQEQLVREYAGVVRTGLLTAISEEGEQIASPIYERRYWLSEWCALDWVGASAGIELHREWRPPVTDESLMAWLAESIFDQHAQPVVAPATPPATPGANPTPTSVITHPAHVVPPSQPDGPFGVSGFRFAGVEVEFGRAAKQISLVRSLWDAKRGILADVRDVEDVMTEVYGEGDEGTDEKFRQLCSDTRTRFLTHHCPLHILSRLGKIQMVRLTK